MARSSGCFHNNPYEFTREQAEHIACGTGWYPFLEGVRKTSVSKYYYVKSSLLGKCEDCKTCFQACDLLKEFTEGGEAFVTWISIMFRRASAHFA